MAQRTQLDDSSHPLHKAYACLLAMTYDSRVQVVDLGSLIKNPMYIGKFHRAVGGRVDFLISP